MCEEDEGAKECVEGMCRIWDESFAVNRRGESRVDGMEIPSERGLCERAVPADTEAISQALCIALDERMLFSAWEEARGVQLRGLGGSLRVTVRQAVSRLCVFCDVRMCVIASAYVVVESPPETGGGGSCEWG